MAAAVNGYLSLSTQTLLWGGGGGGGVAVWRCGGVAVWRCGGK